MRLAAAVCWFDEPTAFLDRLVRSLAGICDMIVAVDGRWRHFADGTHAVSPRNQQAAICRAADAIGVEALLAHRECPWESQVEKRDTMMRLAANHGDWLLIVDGDTFIDRCEAATVRDALERSNVDVATVTVRNLNRPFPHRHLAPQQTAARLLYRAGTRLVGPAHNDYERLGQHLGAAAPTLLLDAVFTIAHDNRNRSPERNAAAASYRRARRFHALEVTP